MISRIVSLQIRGESSGISSETGSLKLAQELPEQAEMTVAEVADLIDRMHGVQDPCNNTRDAGSYLPSLQPGQTYQQAQQNYLQDKYNTTASLENLVGDFGGACLVRQGKPITLTVYAFWSDEDIADNYKLICPVGQLSNKRRIQQRLRLKISVTNTDRVDFGYYVLPGDLYDFRQLFWVGGNIVDRYGKSRVISNPVWDGATSLYWEDVITSGHIFAEFDTIFDQWDCTLQGIWTGAARDYSATVTGIWAGDPPELVLEVPQATAEESSSCQEEINDSQIDIIVGGAAAPPVDPPTAPECEQRIDYEVWNTCTDKLISAWTEYVPAPCDNGKNPKAVRRVSYTTQGDNGCGTGCTAAGFLNICCYPPPNPGCIPACLEYRQRNVGGHLPAGGLDGLKQEYGDDVVVVFAGIDSSTGDCGEHVDRLDVPDNGNCCKDYYVVVYIVNNKLELSGVVDNWSYFASVTNSNPVVLDPPQILNVKSCGDIIAKGYEENSGSPQYWRFHFALYMGEELIKDIDVTGPGLEGKDPNEVYEVYNGIIEVMP